jgi:AcrR family transcriptional regulator
MTHMVSTAPSSTTAGGDRRPRRAGRPTLEQAAQLDQDIRESALRLFLERGYEGTSVDAIARDAGTTKASLYARFESKEAIFVSVLEQAISNMDLPVTELDSPDLDDLEGALTSIARDAVTRGLDPNIVSLSRIVITQAPRFPEIARLTHAAAFWPRRQIVADLLERHAATGAIVADDPEVLAEHFFAMVVGMPARLASFGILHDPAVQEYHTRVAVRLFLRGLRPD